MHFTKGSHVTERPRLLTTHSRHKTKLTMAQILYILVIPTSKDITYFQGWCRDLAQPEFISMLAVAATAPFDTAEVFFDQETLISHRASGAQRKVIALGHQLIHTIPEICKNEFCIIITPFAHAQSIINLEFDHLNRPIIATTKALEGAFKIPFSEIDNPINLFDAPILDKINAILSIKKEESPNKQLREPYTLKAQIPAYGSGSTLANELTHNSLGILFEEKKHIEADEIENFKTAICQGVESLLEIYDNNDREAIIYAPSIQAFLFNTGSHLWNQIFRKLPNNWQKDMIKNGLIKNPGYSGISHPAGVPIENPYSIPYLGEIFSERQKELALTNYSMALLSSSECAPAIRLPNSVNLHAAKLKDIELTHRRSDARSARQLQEKFRALSDTLRIEIGERFEKLITEKFTRLTLCSDAPLEWVYLGNLPLMISHEVSKLGMSPGNMLLQQSALGAIQNVPAKALRDILIIRSFQKHDKIKPFLEVGISAFPLENGVTTTIIDVSSTNDVINALNNFSGGIVIFDCHGDHNGNEGEGWLQIGKERLNTWTLFDKARVPPIVMLSACSTAPIAGSHASVANGLIRSGAYCVIGTFLPVDAAASSAFISRIVYRIDAFLPAIQKLGYEAITWRSLISGFMRMSYATDVLHYFMDECKIITEAQYHQIHMNANIRINSMSESWYDELLSETAAAAGIPTEELLTKIKIENPLMETMLYCQQGRPDLINILL